MTMAGLISVGWRDKRGGPAKASSRPAGGAEFGAVQETLSREGGSAAAASPISQLQHHSKAFPVPLNDDWRVTDDPLQWVLERRKGQARWEGRYYFRTRSGLLSFVKEQCGEIEQEGYAALLKLPVRHS
jgi:hypothetical protein